MDNSKLNITEWFNYLENLNINHIELGLDRIKIVAEYLNLLQPECKIITVGGTNGKGSTCAMLAKAYTVAGYQVGLYTSPHLVNYNERIRLNDALITDADLVESFEAVYEAQQTTQQKLTYFEFGTLSAVWYFLKNNVELMILEVGLGGRLDAVNIFEPDISVLTSVDIDHQAFLGNTREAIGYEKAGIFRPNKPAICTDKNPPQSVIDYANQINAHLEIIHQDFDFVKLEHQWNFKHGAKNRYTLPIPALRGSYQLSNACAMLAVIDHLEDLPISNHDAKRGLLETEWVGRTQVLAGRPLTILDVGHNPHAMKALSQSLGQMPFAKNSFAIFSILQDKDGLEVIQTIQSRIDQWFIAPAKTPRAMSSTDIKNLLLKANIKENHIHLFNSLSSAYDHAKSLCTEEDRLVVFGSFYTVGEIINHLNIKIK